MKTTKTKKDKKSKANKSKKTVKAKKEIRAINAKPINLDRKQAGRLTKHAHIFTSIKTAKKVFVNKQPASKTDATIKVLQAILDDSIFKMISDDPFDDIVQIEV